MGRGVRSIIDGNCDLQNKMNQQPQKVNGCQGKFRPKKKNESNGEEGRRKIGEREGRGGGGGGRERKRRGRESRRERGEREIEGSRDREREK